VRPARDLTGFKMRTMMRGKTHHKRALVQNEC
jgi:hypothetical protein